MNNIFVAIGFKLVEGDHAYHDVGNIRIVFDKDLNEIVGWYNPETGPIGC